MKKSLIIIDIAITMNVMKTQQEILRYSSYDSIISHRIMANTARRVNHTCFSGNCADEHAGIVMIKCGRSRSDGISARNWTAATLIAFFTFLFSPSLLFHVHRLLSLPISLVGNTTT